MKFKCLTIFLLSCLMSMAISGCSKDEPNPEDYTTSVLSGEYGKDGLWKLKVYENDQEINKTGYVSFSSKDLKNGDFIFVNIIPESNRKEFHNIPLSSTGNGVSFKIEDNENKPPVEITGEISLGEMVVKLKY